MSDRWTERLSEVLDDELAAAERRELAEHLEECAGCRTTLAELRRVVARADGLPDRPPAADLWPGIAARIRGRADEAGRSALPALPPLELPEGDQATRGRPRRVVSMTLPQLAAAGLLVALVSAGIVWLLSAGLPGRPGTRQVAGPTAPGTSAAPAAAGDAGAYDAAVAELREALAEGRGDLDSSTVRVLEQNLTLIERSIDQSRRALAADPANPYLRQHLEDTMRRKLELLQRATLVASAR